MSEILSITLYDYYAAHAPENIPGWFRHDPIPQPLRPDIQSLIRDPKEDALGFSKDLVFAIDGWMHDPYYDLGDEYEYSSIWEGARKIVPLNAVREMIESIKVFKDDMVRWRKRDQERRYFQWRQYYANVMTGEKI